ncbi:MAG: PPE family protein [Clostridia bacterium]|nr:PPE family protein [Clostridia bacterium]
MKELNAVKGFKVFKPDWTCRGFQYEVGMTFEEDVTPDCCDRGFHFCKELKDCFNYYDFNPDNKVAKVVALGEIDEESDNSKCCTNKIQIVEEITWEEVLSMVNLGKANSGLCNTGNRNTGDRNTGNRNTGSLNTGNLNTGGWNTGDWNTGNFNTGNRNTGGWNTGNRNTGGWNTGHFNTGDWNTGNCNTGNCNTGNRNTGDWNLSSFNSGCFCTDEHEILIFDKPSGMSYRDWLNSDARYMLNDIPKDAVEWIWSDNMTDEEKAANPTYKTTGGYLKVIDESECGQIWWDGLSEAKKAIIKAIPNFDADKFEKCTGIKLEGKDE